MGAGLMYLLDPDMGTRRRAILRDKLISFTRLAAWAADKTARDLTNRVYGTVAGAKSRFSDIDVDDDVLVERVRSQMGRAVSHPHAIKVTAKNREIRLTGEILADEANDLLKCVSAVKGVQSVKNQLTIHKEPGDISSLQGGHTKRGSQYALLQSHWPPAVRFIVGATGVIAAGIGARQRGIVGNAIATVGTAATLIAITKQSVRQIVNRTVRKTEQTSKGEERARMIEFPGIQRRAG
jgi:hypothetical protein